MLLSQEYASSTYIHIHLGIWNVTAVFQFPFNVYLYSIHLGIWNVTAVFQFPFKGNSFTVTADPPKLQSRFAHLLCEFSSLEECK